MRLQPRNEHLLVLVLVLPAGALTIGVVMVQVHISDARESLGRVHTA